MCVRPAGRPAAGNVTLLCHAPSARGSVSRFCVTLHRLGGLGLSRVAENVGIAVAFSIEGWVSPVILHLRLHDAPSGVLLMHIYIYIYIYTHTYIYTSIYTYTHTNTYIHTYIHIYTHTYNYTPTETHIHTYIPIYTYIYTYMHIYAHI